jgi:type I restriction enzyme S subunit
MNKYIFKRIKLREYINIITDYHANGSYKVLKENITLKYQEDYAIMVRTLNFEANNFSSNLIYINKEAYEFLSKSKVYENDIIMNKIANPGSVYIMPKLNKPVSLAMNLFLIRFNNKLNQVFMYYLMKNNEFYIKKFINGTTTKTITKEAVKDLVFYVPEKNIQNKIAFTLANIDKKIELNNKINQELEAMAKTLYDYWFVQFDFPDSNGKPYKSSGGKMVYNKELKREIPEEWEIVELNKIFDIDSGYPFESNSFLDDGKYKVITIKNVQNKQLNTTKVDFINILPPQISKTSILSIGDVLVSLTGDTGRICFVNEENLLLNQRVGHIYSKDTNIDQSFIYFLMQSESIYKQILQLSIGSNQKNLSPIELLKIKIPYNYNVIVQFIKIIKPIYRKLIINQQENKELSNLRDWLLPMLMNGQVKVK